MNNFDLAEFLSAGAAWTGIVITLLLYLHGRRLKMLLAMERKFDNLQADLMNLAEANRRDHAAQAKQIQDIALTVANNYVRYPQMDGRIKEIQEQIIETRKEFGALHVRIDELLLRRLQ